MKRLMHRGTGWLIYGACDMPELNRLLAEQVGATDAIKRVVDVLLWSGAIGLNDGVAIHFIYTCGYKLAFLHAQIKSNPHLEVCLHSTIARLLAPPPAAA